MFYSTQPFFNKINFLLTGWSGFHIDKEEIRTIDLISTLADVAPLASVPHPLTGRQPPRCDNWNMVRVYHSQSVR